MAERKIRVLLAEDDASLAYVIADNLSDAGYDVVICKDGQSAIDRFDKNKFDICLLDIMMPNKDGYAVAKKIRQQTDVMPILFLSTKTEEEDRLKGYETGADDYISKPFSINELIKKIEVFLRRSKKNQTRTDINFNIGRSIFIPAELRIKTPVEEMTITQKEADLLFYLCENIGKVMKRDEILLQVWGKDDYFLGRSMDVYISKLRKYLKSDPSIILETLHGIGFRLSIAS